MKILKIIYIYLKIYENFSIIEFQLTTLSSQKKKPHFINKENQIQINFSLKSQMHYCITSTGTKNLWSPVKNTPAQNGIIISLLLKNKLFTNKIKILK
jgi:hypothetical protein